MARKVIYSSATYGGVGLLDLYTEQGCSQVQVIISHLRAKGYLYNQIMILLESFMVIAGITTSPLEEIHPISYVSSPWVTSLQTFLSQFNYIIHIPQLKIINLIRVHDKPIMDTELLSDFSKSDQEMINACRIFLQVKTLSEICSHQGHSYSPVRRRLHRVHRRNTSAIRTVYINSTMASSHHTSQES
jgi:hypothetical protein